jgi:hypothetical protein
MGRMQELDRRPAFWRRPPGWLLPAASAGIGILFLVSFVRSDLLPFGAGGSLLVRWLLLVMVVTAWMARGLLWFVASSLSAGDDVRAPRRTAGMVHFLATPAVLALVLLANAFDLPTILAFRASRSALEHAAHGALAFRRSFRTGPRTIGLFHIQAVHTRDDEVYFAVNDWGFFGSGLAYCKGSGPPAPPSDLADWRSCREKVKHWWVCDWTLRWDS